MNRCKKLWGIPIFAAVFALATAAVMLLWNEIVPTVIGWTSISFWQAAGLLLLCKLLFGGLGHRGKGFLHRHHRQFHEHAQLRDELKGMSKEERRSYIRQRMAEMRDCCGNKRPQQNETNE